MKKVPKYAHVTAKFNPDELNKRLIELQHLSLPAIYSNDDSNAILSYVVPAEKRAAITNGTKNTVVELKSNIFQRSETAELKSIIDKSMISTAIDMANDLNNYYCAFHKGTEPIDYKVEAANTKILDEKGKARLYMTGPKAILNFVKNYYELRGRVDNINN